MKKNWVILSFLLIPCIIFIFFIFTKMSSEDGDSFILLDDKKSEVKIIGITDESKGKELHSFLLKIKDEEICYVHGFDVPHVVIDNKILKIKLKKIKLLQDDYYFTGKSIFDGRTIQYEYE
jgi:hypothetical protein